MRSGRIVKKSQAGTGAGEMTNRSLTQQDRAVEAMLFAYVVSCKRSEGRTKWTVDDQRAHEKLRASLTEYMTEAVLDQSVMQIRTARETPHQYKPTKPHAAADTLEAESEMEMLRR